MERDGAFGKVVIEVWSLPSQAASHEVKIELTKQDLAIR